MVAVLAFHEEWIINLKLYANKANPLHFLKCSCNEKVLQQTIQFGQHIYLYTSNIPNAFYLDIMSGFVYMFDLFVLASVLSFKGN